GGADEGQAAGGGRARAAVRSGAGGGRLAGPRLQARRRLRQPARLGPLAAGEAAEDPQAVALLPRHARTVPHGPVPAGVQHRAPVAGQSDVRLTRSPMTVIASSSARPTP